jgi:hypothetical protein
MNIKLSYSIQIEAPPSEIWSVLVDDAKSRQWLNALSAECHCQPDETWSKGSCVTYFDDNVGGTKACIEIFEVYTHLLVRHVALVDKDGRESTQRDLICKWVGTTEEYKLIANDDDCGGTQLFVEVQTHADFEKQFAAFWPRALAKIKRLSGKQRVHFQSAC